MSSRPQSATRPSRLNPGWVRELVILAAFLALCAIGLWAVLIPQVRDDEGRKPPEADSNAAQTR